MFSTCCNFLFLANLFVRQEKQKQNKATHTKGIKRKARTTISVEPFLGLGSASTTIQRDCYAFRHGPKNRQKWTRKQGGKIKFAIHALSKLLLSTKQLRFLHWAGKLFVTSQSISQLLLHNDFLLCFDVFPGQTIGFVHSLASSTKLTTCFTGGVIRHSTNSNKRSGSLTCNDDCSVLGVRHNNTDVRTRMSGCREDTHVVVYFKCCLLCPALNKTIRFVSGGVSSTQRSWCGLNSFPIVYPCKANSSSSGWVFSHKHEYSPLWERPHHKNRNSTPDAQILHKLTESKVWLE